MTIAYVTHPTHVPHRAERFITIVRCLSAAVVAMMAGDQLPAALIKLVVDRLRGIRQRFFALAARLRAGTYVPRRRPATASKRPGQLPPQNPLPTTFGWVVPLLPMPHGNCFRSQLDFLLQDPEMAALLEAAPASLRRPVRSLCRMLGLEPPPILALPPRPKRPADPARPRRPASARSARPAAALHAAGAAAVFAGPGIPRLLRPTPTRLEMTGGVGDARPFRYDKEIKKNYSSTSLGFSRNGTGTGGVSGSAVSHPPPSAL